MVLIKKIFQNNAFIYNLSLKLIYFFIRFFLWTNRLEYIGKENFKNQKKGFLLFWHNRSVVIPYFLPKDVLNVCSTMVSNSDDGQIIVDYLKNWKFKIIRGSTGGKKAILAVKEVLRRLKKENSFVGIAVDGPTGPLYESKKGLIKMISLTNVPVFLISVNFTHSFKLDSWDKLQFPKPFGKVICIVEKVFDDDFKITKDNLDEVRHILNKKLMKITKD